MDTELVLVSGVTAPGVGAVVDRLLTEPGTAVLHHDLADVTSGVVRRRLRLSGKGGPSGRIVVSDATAVLELAHGCVSCTLREDVLPLIRELSRRPSVRRIVLHLDPALEPEQVCWAVLHVLLDGTPVAADVQLTGVITVLDESRFLADAASEDDVTGRGLAALPDDERTIAQLVVGQAEFADLLVLTGGPAEQWLRARTEAVLTRLTPLAPCIELAALDAVSPLAALPPTARRGVPESPHATLLRGQPPLTGDCGVELLVFTARRPFHPERLHDAMDLLLDGVIRTKGRIWLATRPDAVLWIESAGGGLQVGYVDDWLAAGDDEAWVKASAERRTSAALRWHPRYGDRVQELSVLTCGADPAEIEDGLRAALLTDAELLMGEDAWQRFSDPFGWYHTDPCGEVIPTRPGSARHPGEDYA
ncbi:ribosome hibernation factor-recruiting GTPase MRF [Pseudonocardia spinosispora]|uniref:ribosome hibernation factor-recruiting GTPase MRF n=1 Tax=Pseudonocardia spinosispora TaxID=103441 RepID=UPI001FE0FB19|nr:GTP-binding protein [Pseudonocardia spinosispora]